jgi:hypothetical protein
MILCQAPVRRRKRHSHLGSREYDPFELATSLRELASRAYRLIRTLSELAHESGPDLGHWLDLDSECELTDLHAEIIDLERDLRAHDARELVRYVRALRQRVEDYLPEPLVR